MSDDDYSDDYFDPSDYESDEYDDEYDDDEANVENEYYASKDEIENNVDDAIDGFYKVIDMEKDTEQGKGEWGFRSCKRIIKLLCARGDFKEAIPVYKDMLTYIKLVTRNKAEKATGRLLDFVGNQEGGQDHLMEFYELGLEAMSEMKMDRLWAKTRLQQANLCYERGDYRQQAEILKDLVDYCKLENGEDDPKKATRLMEVYASQIQMYTATKDNKKLNDLYQKCQNIQSSLVHPSVMGVICECGGKMHMVSEPELAITDFFTAFRSYTECGNQRRFHCLRYLVLANMLADAEVDPFDAPETKPYRSDSNITSMVSLVNAFQNKEINDFENILANNPDISGDPFISSFLTTLLNQLRTNVILKLVKPYRTLRFSFIAQSLNMQEEAVEALCHSMILDGSLNALIDQVNSLLLVNTRQAQNETYNNIDKWASALLNLQAGVTGKLGAGM